MAEKKKIPRYIGLRIYSFSTLLYFLLVFPFLLFLLVKLLPNMEEFNSAFIPNNDTTAVEQVLLADSILDEVPDLKVQEIIDSSSIFIENKIQAIDDPTKDTLITENTEISDSPVVLKDNENENLQIAPKPILIISLLGSFILGLIFNWRFKKYFSLLQKGKPINEKTKVFVKKYIYKTPIINAGILGLAYLISHFKRLSFIFFFPEAFENIENIGYTPRSLLISFLASALSVLFVYFWWKHRVQTYYIEHIFDENDLRKRHLKRTKGKILNRMLMSAVMTTILPLLIVMAYILTSLTRLDEIENLNYSKGQMEILAGDYAALFLSSDNPIENNFPKWMIYFDAISSSFMMIGIYSGILISLIYIVFFTKWTTQSIVDPVKDLLKNMNETRAGTLNNYSIVRTNDEIGELTEGYNEMTARIGNYIEDISAITDAYARFVPKQFLEYLGRDKVTEIILGDQVQKEMTVLFSDIRSFTSLSEQMTPKQNFDFINEYLGQMEPVIRNNHGFIDKYIGDAIMALFSGQVEDAISASLEMRKTLFTFNKIRERAGLIPIDIGMGIHTGNLMLGVIGGHGRMEGTVISDAVNLASRLEGLTKVYGSSIIISQYTKDKLTQPDKFQYRFIDRTKVKGKDQEVSILEILDGDNDKTRTLKLKTLDKFNEARDNFFANNFIDAKSLFMEVNKIHPADKAASIYLSRCAEKLNQS